MNKLRRGRWSDERQAEMLAILILRLKQCRSGESYTLDPVERGVLLEALGVEK